jgi:hypothetical protein
VLSIPRQRTTEHDVNGPGTGPRDAVTTHSNNIVYVGVWTSQDRWQEHATFVVQFRDGRCSNVEFADPAVSELIIELRRLPGFDLTTLRSLIMTPQSGGTLARLWRAPSAPESRRVATSVPPVGAGTPTDQR